MRKRNRDWKIRFTEDEYNRLEEVINKYGMTKQEYGEKALLRRIMLSQEQYALLQELLPEVQELTLQLRRIGTNINQMARIANATGNLPTQNELQLIQTELQNYGEEANNLWRFLRSLRTRRQPSKG